MVGILSIMSSSLFMKKISKVTTLEATTEIRLTSVFVETELVLCKGVVTFALCFAHFRLLPGCVETPDKEVQGRLFFVCWDAVFVTSFQQSNRSTLGLLHL